MSDLKDVIENYNKTVLDFKQTLQNFTLEREVYSTQILDEYKGLQDKVESVSKDINEMKESMISLKTTINKMAIDIEETNQIKDKGKAVVVASKVVWSILLFIGKTTAAIFAAGASLYYLIKDHFNIHWK